MFNDLSATLKQFLGFANNTETEKINANQRGGKRHEVTNKGIKSCKSTLPKLMDESDSFVTR